MRWWLPLKASTFTGPIDGLFLAILIITGIAFVLVEVGLIWFAVQYRQRTGRKAFYTHGNTRAEIIWTTIPAVTMVALGLISNHYWVQIKGRNSIPANAYPIAIHARSEEHTSELQSQSNLVCRLLLEKKKQILQYTTITNMTTCPHHVSKAVST